MKMSKEEKTRRDDIVTNLQWRADTIKKAIAEYNEALEEAREWCADMVSEINSHIDDKSDRWREGEAGEAHAEWASAFENIELEDLEVAEPDFHAAAISELPEGPNQ